MLSDPEKKYFPKDFIKRVMIIIGVKVLIISFFFFHFLEKSQIPKTPPQMCYQNHCFQLEIADTPEKRELWLMFRESIPEDQGMLFVFDKADFWSFWMRNTLIPLDIIRIDKDNKVVDFISLPPCKEAQCPSFSPKAQAIQAIELNSWSVAKLGIQTGTLLEIFK